MQIRTPANHGILIIIERWSGILASGLHCFLEKLLTLYGVWGHCGSRRCAESMSDDP